MLFPDGAQVMRLSEFLRTHSEQILNAWDEFAATIAHDGALMDQKALRDHAGQILSEIADDLDVPQTDAQQVAKSRGEGERNPGGGDTAAETHADTRIEAGFGIDAMLTEYRALRASVLRMWAEAGSRDAVVDELRQLTRFNEAIDQAIAESVARYTGQVNRSTNLFMGMLGHDIRNPLGTIRLSAELLTRTGQLSAKAAEPIVNAAKRIQGIVELVIDFSHAQSSGVMPINVRRMDLGALAENVLAETRVRHPANTLVLLGRDLDTECWWDEGRIGQLLSNLLENAMLYGTRGGTVTLALSADAGTAGFSVHNEGRPIPLDSRERIFEPRHRGDGTLAEQRSSNGLGLGLYICREIVRSHGGTLAVRSAEGEGTTFLVRVPRRQAGAEAPASGAAS
jgi:signal transduction histidine kinase